LAALIVVGTIHVAAWMAVTPAFQGPDEPAHFSYAQHLAETGSAPQKVGGNGRHRSTEQTLAMDWAGLHSLIGVLDARPAWSDAEERRWEEVEASLPDEAGADGEGPNAVAGNPPLYYAYEAVAYHVAPGGSLFARFHAMRIASALLYLAMIPLAWLIAAELFTWPWARALATAIVALQPKLASLGGSINPDVLLATVWTAFIYVAVRTLRRGPSRGRLAAAGLLAAASLLTHGRGLAILGPLAALLVLTYRRHRPERRTAVWGAGLSLGIVAAGAATLLVFRALSTGEGAYAGEISGFSEQSFNLRQFFSYLWQFYLPKLGFMESTIGPQDYGFREVFVQGFFADYAHLELTLPRSAVDLLQLAMIALFIALYTLAVVRRDTIRQWCGTAALLLIAGLSMILLVHLVSYRNLLGTPDDPLYAGRYLLPLVSIFAVGVTTVVAALPRRFVPVAAGLIVGVGITLTFTGLGMSLVRFYA
jgi:4-amino-4-deoxy-L-arabinose transferase-like glycosyltransferase